MKKIGIRGGNIMKKIMAIIASMAVMMSFAACGDKNDTSIDTENTAVSTAVDTAEGEETNNDDGVSVTDSAEITVDDVRNHAETPASDFEYVDHGDSVSIKAYNGSDPIVVIPEQIDGKDVISIIDGPFNNDSFIKGISLSATIKEIGDSTFGLNDSLQVVLASGVETVGRAAFRHNDSLKYVDLGDNLKEFDDAYFSDTLEVIHIPEGVENLDKVAFFGEDALTIVGKAGSFAETFAKEEGINFEEE